MWNVLRLMHDTHLSFGDLQVRDLRCEYRADPLEDEPFRLLN